METAYFSDSVSDVIQASGRLAIQFGYDVILPEHLLLAIIDESLKQPVKGDIVLKVFKHFHINLFELIEDIEQTFDTGTSSTSIEKIPYNNQTQYIIKLSFFEARKSKDHIIGVEHLLLSYLQAQTVFLNILSGKYRLSYAAVSDYLRQIN